MQYAVIKSGSKQYQVKVGQTLEIELLESSKGSVVFDHVLLVVNDDQVQVGTPEIEGFKVYATVLKEVKGDKIQVFKYKSKSRYRKLRGHRQTYALVKIDSLGAAPAAAPVKKEPVKKAAPKKAKK